MGFSPGSQSSLILFTNPDRTVLKNKLPKISLLFTEELREIYFMRPQMTRMRIVCRSVISVRHIVLIKAI